MNSWKWDLAMVAGMALGGIAGVFTAIGLWQFIMVPVLGAVS